jgi:ubiquinone/menaquinone biosynthesis C-methylase UbiE
MSTPNQLQRDAWNGDSGQRWVADADRRDQVLSPVADALLAAAELHPGESVVDIGCGCGATSIAAAQQVDPGRAVGLDLSAPMLDLARQRAGQLPVEFLQADAQTDPIETEAFDIAISRFGTMFFDDPVAAFTNIRRGVRGNGTLCIATWQPLAANDWLTIPGAALLRYGTLPDTATATGGPGMFAQSDPDTITAVLADAGWHAVEVDPVTVTLRLGADADEATDYLADTGIARSVLETIDPAERHHAVDAVREALARCARPEGVCLPASIFIAAASASS